MSTISASTTSTTAYVVTGDSTGTLVFKTGSTPTTAMTIDTSQNMGLGVTPSAWSSSSQALQNSDGAIWRFPGSVYFAQNYYFNGTNRIYVGSAEASEYEQRSGEHRWSSAASGTAGGTVSLSRRMTLDASGNFIVGGTSANGRARIVAAASTDCVVNLETSTNNYASGLTLNALNSNGAIYNFINSKYGSTEMWYVGGNGADSTLVIKTGGTERARIDSSGNLDMTAGGSVGRTSVSSGIFFGSNAVLPSSGSALADNTKSMGSAAWRWSVIYAGTGTINTSDAREKTSVSALTTSEVSAAKQIASEIGSYKFLSAVEQKGENARKHIGMTVQRAVEIMEANGLTPFNYGFICLDEWASETTEDGAVIKEAGSRYGFRMDELSMFIARGQQASIQEQQAIIEQLTNRISALENK